MAEVRIILAEDIEKSKQKFCIAMELLIKFAQDTAEKGDFTSIIALNDIQDHVELLTFGEIKSRDIT